MTVPIPRRVNPNVLPDLVWDPTDAHYSRLGHPVELVAVHRWGVRYTNATAEAASYHGVRDWFRNPRNGASSHLVYPGSAVPGEQAQMVAWSEAAWTEAADNRRSVEVESADAIWLGADAAGFAQLARIVGYLLVRFHVPAVWSAERGFCRHADLGQAGGGHLECPTTDLHLWRAFVELVQENVRRGGYRKVYGR